MAKPILAPGAVTQTSATVTVTDLAADGTLEVQYGVRDDFQLCVAPLIKGIARGNFTVTGLNPGTLYYIRARSRRANGVAEDWSKPIATLTSVGAVRVTAPSAIMIEPAMVVVPAPVLAWSDVGNTAAGYPLENLGFDGPVAWVSKLAAGNVHTFVAELGPAPVNVIALLMSNAASDATVTIRAGSTSAGSDYTYGPVAFRASAALPSRPGYHALIELPAIRQHRFWRVEITSANFDRVFHLEHAVFGWNRESKNHSVDKAESVIDYGTYDRTRSGIPIRSVGARLRRVDFDISMLTEEQYETLYSDLDQLVGQIKPILCVPNSKSGAFLHDRILYGSMRGGRVVNPASPRYTRAFTIESII